jgi:multiple sugar transport system ATP-binding protein
VASLSLKNIKKVYGKDVVAVQDFSLDINDKEFVVFVGPSGCGKSTTLRMIAGLEDISEGELFIDDKKVNNVMPKDRDIAMVFQNYALYPHMTVFENMAFALKLRKVPKADIKRRVREAAEILEITDYLQRKPKALSGGQRQRVAIGRAIVRHPKVFLMDEPLSNLDAKLRNQMRTELVLIRKRVDTTFVYVTHDQTEAMTLGDRIVVMKDGFIQQIGTPREVFQHPNNLFVAGFIGTPQMNFFDAVLHCRSDGYTIEICGNEIVLPASKQQKLKEKGLKEQTIVAGVRPEDIFVAGPEKKADCCSTVLMSEMLGSEVFMHVNIGPHTVILKLSSSMDEDTNFNFIDKNTELNLVFNKEKIHLFDKETERTLL